MHTHVYIELIDERKLDFITLINFYRWAGHRAVVGQAAIGGPLGDESDPVGLGYDLAGGGNLTPRWGIGRGA
jgi:hypothetical protein